MKRAPRLWIVFSVLLSTLTGFTRTVPATEPDSGSSVEIERINGDFQFSENGRKVLRYRAQPVSRDGKFSRSQYVHPLYGLDGEVLTEDFPADHPHHRGIFWAWHQIYIGETAIGDSWSLEDFSYHVQSVEIGKHRDPSATLEINSTWESPRWKDANGQSQPFVQETVTLRVHPTRNGVQLVDFRIDILALEDNVSIGGSNDAKGYGGFSTRLRLPSDVRFRGRKGDITPFTTAVRAGPWVDISGSFSRKGARAGVTILCHPSTPRTPREWILRRKASMQNHAFPGRERYQVSRREPLVLRYRIAIHAGELSRSSADSLLANYAAESDIVVLDGTQPITWPEEDLSERLMDGAHLFVHRMIDESLAKRAGFWNRDGSSPERYETSVAANRDRLRQILGVTRLRAAPSLEQFAGEGDPLVLAETADYTVVQARWPVVVGVLAEGLLVRQKRPPLAKVVALPDADQTPEQLLGLAAGTAIAAQYARWLAENGCEVLIPTLVDRRPLATDNPRMKRSRQTHREWLYRQAFHMGRHVIGFEVQTALAAIDRFRADEANETPIGIVGYGEGGLIAFHAAALDLRIDAALVSGYFDSRQSVWSEPIYRNVWGLLREFGDAEIASLILPRSLVIENAAFPAVRGHKGDLATPAFERILAEYERIPSFDRIPRPELIHGLDGNTVGPGSRAAVERLAAHLGIDSLDPLSDRPPKDLRKSPDPSARHARVLRSWAEHVQRLVRDANGAREKFFMLNVQPELKNWKWTTKKDHPVQDHKKFVEGARRFRQLFRDEAMGIFVATKLPANARTRRILSTKSWIAYDVVLDVYSDLFAWGVLLVPKGIPAGEKRPVVVCQHGRNGVPRDTIDRNKTAYNNFAAALAERGFVVFSPHNLYRYEDRYRWLDRKANSIKASLFSFIIAQHEQILEWLDTLAFVDGERIAFYGLSYGGETAVRVPAAVEKYALSICSGDFNQWTRKVASTNLPFSFMGTIEWEMPYWNLGNTFDYAEMTYLIFPRPFMVERGHHDAVSRDHWVAHEYAKVRWFYAQFGLSDRTEIEYFQGGHSIRGEGTFDFLHRHLRWPKRD